MFDQLSFFLARANIVEPQLDNQDFLRRARHRIRTGLFRRALSDRQRPI